MRAHDGRAIPTFLRQALKDQNLTVFGDGSQTRSFCYVDDLIRGIVALAESDVHTPVNVGNPNEFTLLELAKTVIEVTESRSEIVYEPLPVDDPQQRQPDITRARDLLGWEPKVELREGLRRTIEQAGVERSPAPRTEPRPASQYPPPDGRQDRQAASRSPPARSRPSSGPTTSGSSPTRGSRSTASTPRTTSRRGSRSASARPASRPSPAASTTGMYRDRLWTMRQYAGFASPEDTNERYRYLIEHGSTGLSMAFDLPTQLGRDSDDPLCHGEVGRTGVPIDTIEDMRICFDQIPLDGVSTSMTINAPAAILLLLYELVGEEQGVPPREAARHGPERRAQGVHGARQLHLPARADDAADHRHLRVLPRERAEMEHDLDLRLPHPREGLLGRAGGRLHALQRDRLRRGGARAGPEDRRVRDPARLLLQLPQQRLPGGRQVPRRAADVGEDRRRAVRGARTPTR